MPSGKNLEQILVPTLCFGDISRDEINTVLNIAGVSLTPPKKTPFATGIQRRKRAVVNTPVFVEPKQQEYRRKFETVFVEPEEGDDDIPRATEATLIIADGKPVHRKLEEKKLEAKIHEEKKPEEKKLEEKKPEEKKPEEKKPIAKKSEEKKKHEEKKAEQKKETVKPTKEQPQQKQHQKAASNGKKESTPSTIPSQPPVTASPAPPAVNGTKTPASPTSSVEASPAEPSTPQPAAKPVPFSWASLVKKPNESAKPKTPANASSAAGSAPVANGKQPFKPAKSASSTPSATPKFTGVADIISKYEPNYKAPLIQPRGLINNVNTCFMNVILQPLLHCAPFYNLVKTISSQTAQTLKSKTPLLDSIIEFINEFQTERLDNLEPYGEPFVPEYVYNALRNQKKFDTLRGRQEDSEEFLCFLLDGLHEEMATVLKEQKDKKDAEAAAAAAANGEGNDWLEVGAKNKTSNLRSTGFDESPISKIFCGKLRSVLRCPGAKDSINQEPYQSLPLDIQPENVHTVEDAIANMTIPETMHDYTSPKGLKVDATKQVYLEGLPPVLILHMKRFVFDNVGGVQKLSKQVKYGSKLVIDPEWMVPASRSHEPITYQLFGSVYHHGSSAGGGHYTCDIKRRSGEWLHIDDTTITSVSEQDVLVTEENTRTSEKLHAGQTAYILFYVRSS